ncbi:MAG: hypothetical protein R2867_42625 [Caldilineaceae bacterium]
MNTIVFIVLIAIGASLLCAALIIGAAIMSSRSTARLVDKYPEIYGEDAIAETQRRVELSRKSGGNSHPVQARIA